MERGREYKWGKSKGGGREDAEEGSPRGGVRAPSCTGSAYGAGLPALYSGGKRFCFLVTFIWALGDVGVRALHKSGVAVCECRHRDINPGARRLPSGYLFLLLLRLFFVAPVYFPNLFLSFAFPSPSSSLGADSFISFRSVSSRLMSLPRDSRAQYGAPCSAYNVPNHCFSPVAPFALGLPSHSAGLASPHPHACTSTGSVQHDDPQKDH